MRVSIWDIDYYNLRRGFNVECMKISSFHKQRGDVVNFILKQADVNRVYDIIYIVKKDDELANPPLSFLDKRSRLWGDGFRYISNWKLSDAMLGCRPDYMLYPENQKDFSSAEMARFFNKDGEILPLTQDYHNALNKREVLVTDDAFWRADKKNIIWALDQLQDENNVSFLDPISLRILFSDKIIKDKFLSLNLSRKGTFEFKNDYGESMENIIMIRNFLLEVHKRVPFSNMKEIGFTAVTHNHFKDKDLALDDFIRCLQIVDIRKESGVRFSIKTLRDRHQTPYYTAFETVITWSQNNKQMSLLEFIALPIQKKLNCSLYEVYSDYTKWDNIKFREIVAILVKHKELIHPYALRQYNNRFLPLTKINWVTIEEIF